MYIIIKKDGRFRTVWGQTPLSSKAVEEFFDKDPSRTQFYEVYKQVAVRAIPLNVKHKID